MKIDEKWRGLGWRHPLWDYVRLYTMFGKTKASVKNAWMDQMRSSKLEIVPGEDIPIPPEHASLFFDYLAARDESFAVADGLLRTEEEALAFCQAMRKQVLKNVTQMAGYYQSAKALIAGVAAVAELVCEECKVTFVPSPQRRCVWLKDHHLHVTARNLDGAVPDLLNPSIVWEIKEYWGQTKGGSKMSDAVYECNLVGRELREFEERSGARIAHVVFVDGKTQWSHRGSDLRRFIDLFHQGLIDHLFVGREVETEWPTTLSRLITSRSGARKPE